MFTVINEKPENRYRPVPEGTAAGMRRSDCRESQTVCKEDLRTL